MAAPLYLTKGELRAKLLIRLGYGGLGAGAGMFVPIADDLLEEAQEQLFQIFTDEKGVREWEFSTGVNQRWYDIPLTCDIDRIMGMYAQQNGDYWHPLIRGIGSEHDSDYEDIEDYPYRYDIRANPRPVSPNLQDNSAFSTDDLSVEGGEGFTWASSEWEISGGELRTTGIGSAFAHSTTPVFPAVTYDIEYTVDGAALTAVSIGSKATDVGGAPLGIAIGTHSHQVTTATGSPFSIIGDDHVRLDNVSIKQIIADQATVQIEIWPKPDDNYLMKIEGPMVLGPFVSDGDRASFDSRLILLYAVAYGKAHLNRQDAKSAMDAWTLRLSKIKSNQHGTREYVRRNPSRPETAIRSRPKVV